MEPGSEIDVVSHSEIIDKATRDFNEGRNTCVHLDVALIRDQHIRHELEQGGLPLTITSDNTDCFSGLNLKVHIP